MLLLWYVKEYVIDTKSPKEDKPNLGIKKEQKDDDNFKKLHTIQAKLIKQSVSSVSFSKILNDTISQCLKKQ